MHDGDISAPVPIGFSSSGARAARVAQAAVAPRRQGNVTPQSLSRSRRSAAANCRSEKALPHAQRQTLLRLRLCEWNGSQPMCSG